MTELPISLGQDKLVECVFEIRFNEEIESEVLFANVYTLLSIDGFIHKKNQHADLPDEILKKDPIFEFMSFYKFSKQNYNVQIGPKVINISISAPYQSWLEFKNFIDDKISKFKRIIEERTIKQVSMRYVNFFDNFNIFDNINIEIKDDFLCNNFTSLHKKAYRTVINCNNLEMSLQIDNSVGIMQELSKAEIKGSVIDIDLKSNNKISTIEEILENAELLHTKIKETFFNILKEEYIMKNLAPKFKE